MSEIHETILQKEAEILLNIGALKKNNDSNQAAPNLLFLIEMENSDLFLI